MENSAAINWKNFRILQAYQTALAEGTQEEIYQFWNSGAPLNDILPCENTPLGIIIDKRISSDKAVLNLTTHALQTYRANPNQADKNDVTPLHWAVRNNHGEMVKLLLANGADIHKEEKSNGNTPLHWAARNDCGDIVKLLLASGANVNQTGKGGATPIYWAAWYGHSFIVKLLLAGGAEVDLLDETGPGATPLLGAARNGHTEVVRLLLAAGANVNKATKHGGDTPLHWAARNDQTETARILINSGADVNKATHNDHDTPLHWAAQAGRAECVRLLLASGADVTLINNAGCTPIDMAFRAAETLDSGQTVQIFFAALKSENEYLYDAENLDKLIKQYRNTPHLNLIKAEKERRRSEKEIEIEMDDSQSENDGVQTEVPSPPDSMLMQIRSASTEPPKNKTSKLPGQN